MVLLNITTSIDLGKQKRTKIHTIVFEVRALSLCFPLTLCTLPATALPAVETNATRGSVALASDGYEK